MPPPVVVYVLAVAGTVAVGFAFKELIYDPHIHPWLVDVRERRRERKRRQQLQTMLESPVGVDGNDGGGGKVAEEEMQELGTRSGQLRARGTLNRQLFIDDDDVLFDYNVKSHESPSSQSSSSSSSSYSPIPRVPLVSIPPVHSPSPSPSPPSPMLVATLPPLPPPAADITSTLSSPRIPSLSQSHPLQLDAEADVELLSRPSSVALSPAFAITSSPVSSSSSSLSEHTDVDNQSHFDWSSDESVSLPPPSPAILGSSTTLLVASRSHPLESPVLGAQSGVDERSDLDLLSDLDGSISSGMSWEDAVER